MQNIFWYIFYGVLSTFLVHPWYIKGLLKGKTIFKDYDSYYNFGFREKMFIYLLTISELVLISFNMNTLYENGNLIAPPYTSPIIILCIIVAQLLNFLLIMDTQNYKKIFLGIFIYAIILLGINYKFFTVTFKTAPNIMNYEHPDNILTFIPDPKIYSVTDVKIYEEDNFKCLLENDEDYSTITILNNESNDYTKINLNESLYSDNKTIRNFCPNKLIKYTGLTITKDKKVYKTYVIMETKAFDYKDNTFSHFVLRECNGEYNKFTTLKIRD